MHPYPHDPHNPDDAAGGEPADHSVNQTVSQTGKVPLVRVGGLVDLIAAVPYVLTYAPADAVVVMAFVGDRLRVTACQSLPAPSDVRVAVHHLDRALARACSEGAGNKQPGGLGAKVTHALVVGYGDAGIDPILTGIARELMIPVRDVVRVDGDRWWSLTCPDPACCPPGAPIVVAERVRLGLVVAAGVPAPARSDRARELQPAPSPVLDQVAQQIAARADTPIPPDPGRQYALLTAAKARRLDGQAALAPGEAAALLLAVADVRVRDACILWNEDAAVHLWRDLVRLAPPGWVAPVATLLALAAYQRGDSVLANLALDRALDDDPRHRLAGMVRQVLRMGLPPDRLAADLQETAPQVLSQLALPRTNPPATPGDTPGGTPGGRDAGHGHHDRRM
ncbi:MAG TPA: DUF4192 domain-containing protein [Kineosporiaceae bacterium]